MKKKAAIITIYGETNFGNRLQNYAVHKCLTQLGLDCETLVFEKTQPLTKIVKDVMKRALCCTIVKNNEMNRVISFLKFSRKYIPRRRISPGYPYEALATQYDYFVVGSDQVWNPCFGNYESYFDKMFLTFAPIEKRVCFSPSFGVSDIPAEWKDRFQNALVGFNQISVREDDGVRIVKELTGKDAVCLIDPTMLFDGEEWIKVARKPAVKDYIFTYFLGECNVDFLPKDKKIMDILDKESGNYYKYNPSDFIGLIANSEAVYTDSFHACVFSILFDKPFCVMERRDGYSKMSSRIQTLLSMFGIDYDSTLPTLIHVNSEVRDRVLAEKREDLIRFLCAQIATEDV